MVAPPRASSPRPAGEGERAWQRSAYALAASDNLLASWRARGAHKTGFGHLRKRRREMLENAAERRRGFVVRFHLEPGPALARKPGSAHVRIGRTELSHFSKEFRGPRPVVRFVSRPPPNGAAFRPAWFPAEIA